ncbi:MAG: PEGA domain-containing protein [Methylococcaceae bacterium]
MKLYLLLLIAALFTLGCDSQPKEIMIASNPGQAKVKLGQAELGLTPLKVKIENDTAIEVSKPGYQPFTTVLSPTADPNLIVILVEDGVNQINALKASPPGLPQTGAMKANAQPPQKSQPNDTLTQGLQQNLQLGATKEVLVVSKPCDANVRLNQKDLGTTPLKVTVQKDSAIEISKPGYRSYVNILSPGDQPHLIVTLNKEPARAKAATPRLSITRVKQLYQQGRINKLDYSAKIRQLEHQLETDLIDLKMLYKRGGINSYDYERRVREIKHRYRG